VFELLDLHIVPLASIAALRILVKHGFLFDSVLAGKAGNGGVGVKFEVDFFGLAFAFELGGRLGKALPAVEEVLVFVVVLDAVLLVFNAIG